MKIDPKPVKALVFDAYGTLFDVDSLITALSEKFPGQGDSSEQYGV